MLTAQPLSCHMLDRRKLSFARPACARVCRGAAVPVPSSAHPSVTVRRRLVARFRNGADASAQQAQTQQAVAGGGTAVPVVFELCKHCPFGHTFALVGDALELGEWDVSKALRLEWSEGDVWIGRAELALDAPVSFKYVQLDGAGGLVSWGQDIAGGSNISLLVTPSDEVMSGLQLTMEPTEAADRTHQPYLIVRLDSAAILPESAARFKEAEALRLAAEEDEQAAAAAAAAGEDEQTDQVWEDPLAAVGQAAQVGQVGQVCAEPPGPAEADAVMSADEVDMQPQGGLADEPSAEHDDEDDSRLRPANPDTADAQQQQQDGPADSQDGVVSQVGQLQLQDESTSETETDSDGWSSQPDEPAVVAAVIKAGPETTSESVQGQGLQQLQDTTQGAVVGADAAGEGAASEASGSPADPLAAGGVAAGYGDESSVGAAVAAGLMEAGDDEITAGFMAPVDTPTQAANPAGSSSSGDLRSHMLTSMDQEESETDESTTADDVTDSLTSAGDDVSDGLGKSVIDSTPGEPDREQLMAATAQESARLASSRQADTTNGQPVSSAAAADNSRGSLEGLPTPANSDAAAVAYKMMGAKAIFVADAEGCRPPNPHSKIIAASPSYATVDPDAPLQDINKPVTEIDSSSTGFQPVDSYEGALGALTVLAAAAAASFDGGEHHKETGDREGAAAAAAEARQMQLVRADEGSAGVGDGEGTGTWTGGAAAAGGASGDGVAQSSAAASSAVDGERTGTWTGEAAAAAADGGGSSRAEGSQRASELGQAAAATAADSAAQGDAPTGSADGGSEKRKRNWLQRLFSGGGNEDDRA